jgi:hypothetical protein
VLTLRDTGVINPPDSTALTPREDRLIILDSSATMPEEELL